MDKKQTPQWVCPVCRAEVVEIKLKVICPACNRIVDNCCSGEK